jgi:L-asparaginase
MTQAAAGVAPSLTADDLLAATPGLADAADIEAHSPITVPGAHLTLADVIALSLQIERSFASGAAGAVVVQGTDTLEETAFALDLLVGGEQPVVVTGAMRHPAMAGADGPANLLAAAFVAASDEARGLGSVVVLNDEIHAARFVAKSHTTLPSAFMSPGAGPLGWCVEGRVRIRTRLRRAATLRVADQGAGPRVPIVATWMGDDGALLQSVLDSGCDGMVIAAFGAAHVPPAVSRAAGAAARHVPVVVASRVGAGQLLQRTYDFPGSESDLRRNGVISAGWLAPVKARVMLDLLLRGDDPTRVEAAFAEWAEQ